MTVDIPAIFQISRTLQLCSDLLELFKIYQDDKIIYLGNVTLNIEMALLLDRCLQFFAKIYLKDLNYLQNT